MGTIVPNSDTVCKLFLPLSDKDVKGRAEFSIVQTSPTVKSGEKTIAGVSKMGIISGKVIRWA
jgi:hypothetical protein